MDAVDLWDGFHKNLNPQPAYLPGDWQVYCDKVWHLIFSCTGTEKRASSLQTAVWQHCLGRRSDFWCRCSWSICQEQPRNLPVKLNHYPFLMFQPNLNIPAGFKQCAAQGGCAKLAKPGDELALTGWEQQPHGSRNKTVLLLSLFNGFNLTWVASR